jgi:hypothetical protein
MEAMGMSPDLTGVAEWVSPWATALIIDTVDALSAGALGRTDLEVSTAPILDQTAEDRAELVAAIFNSTSQSA